MATYKVSSITITPVVGDDRAVTISWAFAYTATKYKFSEYVVTTYYAQSGKYILDSKTTQKTKTMAYEPPATATSIKVYITPRFAEGSGNTGAQASKEFKYSSVTPAKPTITDVSLSTSGTHATVTITNTDADAAYWNVVGEDTSDGSVIYNSGWIYATAGFDERFCNFNTLAGKTYRFKARVKTSAGVASDYNYYKSGGLAVSVKMRPLEPVDISSQGIMAGGNPSAIISWSNGGGASEYDIQYTDVLSYFTTNPAAVTEVTGHPSTTYTPTDLASGSVYYFRVRAANEYSGDAHYSAWSEPVSCAIGTQPTAPTVWFESNSVVAGTDLVAHWHHNCEDGCAQQEYEGAFIVNGVETQVSGTTATQESFDTSGLTDGTEVQFYVRTKGILDDFSDYSETISATAWATPTLQVEANADDVAPLEALPLVITSTAGSSVLAYDLFIKAATGYTYTDPMGREVDVAAGDVIWSGHFDTTETPFDVELSAGDISLVDGNSYLVGGSALMASGLTANAVEMPFDVDFDYAGIQVNADVSTDNDSLIASVVPYAETLADDSFTTSAQTYTVAKAEDETFVLYSFTVDGDEVDVSITDNGTSVVLDWEAAGVAVCDFGIGTLSDCVLSVFRIGYDGELIHLASNIPNTRDTVITDPHPSLKSPAYRIVATDNDTGAVYYADVTGESFREHSIVIQWAEEWTDFDLIDGETPEGVSYSGSILKMPCDIEINESASPDAVGSEYIGRECPVFYYGTQKGRSASFSASVGKDDEQTIASLRALQSYMGDAYVREPSGSGYWAHVTVSIQMGYGHGKVPVTIEATRADHAEVAL